MAGGATQERTGVDTADGFVPTVLIVEDDPVARRFYADALAASGYRVEQAANGSEALRSASGGISAVVADLGLPDFDGFEVCRHLKSDPRSSRVPVIALTGRAMALRDIELAEEVGFSAVLIKPCPPETLVAAIAKALNGRSSRFAPSRG
jgi:two-component system, cell cycle response regulator DivK